jgi:PPOX class probable F420-dependent enzyme
MSIGSTRLDDGVLEFLAERHLASVTTMRPNGTPHVVPVGFTFDPATRIARIITRRASVKVRNVRAGSRAVLCQIDGRRWLSLEGEARVRDDAEAVAEAVHRYAQRYRQPQPNPERVAITIAVDRILGHA